MKGVGHKPESKMNRKTKIGLIVGTITLSVAVITAGALALFTARTDSNFSAKAGTVTIELDELAMTNSENINPGDNDPSNPEGSVEGTTHDFTYVVTNTGNKSVRTRHTVMLTVDKAGESEQLLDARYLALFQDAKEIASKTYVLEDDSEVTNIDKETKKVKAVKYVFISDVFDGKGKNIEDGGDAEKETVSGVVKENEKGDVEKQYSYDFSLLRTATNEYQASDISITVTIEAMQYRNTNDADWSESATVIRKYSNADVKASVVPASNEDKNGNEIK